MTSPLFTTEQWEAIENLFESRWNRPGSLADFSKSILIARDAISKFEDYFENLSPQLIGTEKDALFAIKNDFNDLRHSTYQAAGAMEIRYKKFKLQLTKILIEHLDTKEEERIFKNLIGQSQSLQNKLTKFHSTYFWCEMNKWGIIISIIGASFILFGRVLAVLIPETSLSTFIYIIAISLLLAGLTTLGLIRFFQARRDPTTTMKYLEEIHKQIDKLRFQFDDLRAIITDDATHELMQQELNVVIDSIKELKLLCFP